tara:strand:- start:86 stop:511 length:426 start_codon:yes stop_codon:yes gene_type:complete
MNDIEKIMNIYDEILDTSKDLQTIKEEIISHMVIHKDCIKVDINQLRSLCLDLNMYCIQNLQKSKENIQLEGLKLFIKKNRDYGDSYKICGSVGVLVRMLDKINRLLNLSNITEYVIDENYQDTLLDLYNYTLLTIICIDE